VNTVVVLIITYFSLDTVIVIILRHSGSHESQKNLKDHTRLSFDQNNITIISNPNLGSTLHPVSTLNQPLF